MKKTVVLGASPDPSRYSFMAVERLARYGHLPVPVGNRDGSIGAFEILRGRPEVADVDTLTLYLNPERQKDFYEYIFSLGPKRLIFNPGAENPELAALAAEKGIETVEGCTLVMLGIGTF